MARVEPKPAKRVPTSARQVEGVVDAVISKDLGVRRISVGSALARVAWGAFIRAAKDIAETGTFESLASATPLSELNALMSARPR